MRRITLFNHVGRFLEHGIVNHDLWAPNKIRVLVFYPYIQVDTSSLLQMLNSQ